MAHTLIASDRIEGTAVCRPDGEMIGAIERLMLDKISGHVAYAVLKTGGFLGFGEKHFPVPWASLKYNFELGSYEIDLSEEQLRNAVSSIGDEFDWGDRSDEIVVRTLPRSPTYWI